MKIVPVFLRLCIVLIIFLSFPIGAAAARIYVDDDNFTGVEDGSSQHPYNTIQEAVSASSETGGDTILIAGGSYSGNVDIDNRTVHLSGGYPGGTSTEYDSGTGGIFTGQDIETYVTWIQGDGTAPSISLVDAGSSTVDGCRITGGTGLETEWDANGGGIYVSGGSPTISGNIIENNDVRKSDVTSTGGGIFSESSDITISGNTIRNNSAGGGGGIAIDGGHAVITGNTVQGNKAYDFAHGGGLLVDSPDATVKENRFIQNEVGRDLGYGWGGGVTVYGEGCSTVLSNNIYVGNYAATAGGGLFVDDGATAAVDHELIYNNQSIRNGSGVYVDGAWDEVGSTAAFSHCTIADNVCTDCSIPGHGMAVEYYSSVTVENSIFWRNGGDDFFADETASLAVTYTLSEETVQGQGNLNSDPFFADAANGDFHLQSTFGRWHPVNDSQGEWLTDSVTSPAIDVANPVSSYTAEPNPNGARANLGVYGNTDEASKSGTSKAETEMINFNGLAQSENISTNIPISITVNAQEKNSRTVSYRFSMHPDYGTSAYDGRHWSLMGSSEWVTDSTLNYTFNNTGEYIIVVWATTTDTRDGVNSTGIPIIGWSVDVSDTGCKTNFTGLSITGDQKVNQQLTFAVTVADSCDNTLYYRFSMHPDYGTSRYDGKNWQLMTNSEWVSANSLNYTFTQSGKYIVVVWVSDTSENVNSTGIPIIGWSMDIE